MENHWIHYLVQMGSCVKAKYIYHLSELQSVTYPSFRVIGV